jgi:lipopolysaccharide export system permease protein
MTTIDRYIFKELGKVFLISAGATTALLYLDKFLFMAEMIISRGVSFLEMLLIMIYISPAFLSLTIPMSVLIASVVTFNQFSYYNEWVAMKACNMSFMRIMKPVFIFSIGAYLLANVMMFYALPWGNQGYKQLIFDIIQNRANFDIKPNVFNRDFKNLVLLVREKSGKAQMKGVFIADQTQPDSPQMISAREGIIIPDSESLRIQLQLKNGTIHQTSNKKGDYQTLNFDRYDLTLSLPDTERLQQEALVGNRELSLGKLLEKIDELEAKGLKTSGAKVELSKKFSIPFTCLIFGIFGAPLGVKSSRSGKSGSFGASITIIVFYYLGLISMQNLGRVGEINPYLSVWIPNMVFLALGFYLMVKMQKELPFRIFERLADLTENLAKGTVQLIKSLIPARKNKSKSRLRRTPSQQDLDRAAKELLHRNRESPLKGKRNAPNSS